MVAEMAIEPGVINKIGSMLGNPIAIGVRGAEQFVKRLARGGVLEVNVFHLQEYDVGDVGQVRKR